MVRVVFMLNGVRVEATIGDTPRTSNPEVGSFFPAHQGSRTGRHRMLLPMRPPVDRQKAARLRLSLHLLLLLAPTLACGFLGPDEEATRDIEILRPYVAHLEAWQAAMGSAPSEADGLEIPADAPLHLCGSDVRCSDGAVNNTVLVGDRDITYYRELLDDLENGRDNPNLSYFREYQRERFPNLRYFYVEVPEDVQQYRDETSGHWRGRVAAWDTSREVWIGAVRIDIQGEPAGHREYETVDSHGNAAGPAFSDRSEDNAAAQRDFDAERRDAVRTALETGRPVGG